MLRIKIPLKTLPRMDNVLCLQQFWQTCIMRLMCFSYFLYNIHSAVQKSKNNFDSYILFKKYILQGYSCHRDLFDTAGQSKMKIFL